MNSDSRMRSSSNDPIALSNTSVFTGTTMLKDHAVVLAGDTIEAVKRRDHIDPNIERIDLNGGILAPGFLDLQVNGGGGGFFNASPDLPTLEIICNTHRRFGTTALLPTLLSDTEVVLKNGIETVRSAIKKKMPGIIGVHLEGPYLNFRHRGVHLGKHIAPGHQGIVDFLASLGDGTTLVTLAPECVPKNLITRLVKRGIHVVIGHSAATYEQARAALVEGACGFTHLFNAMTPLQSREPGCVGAALDDTESWFGIIADGCHVHPATIRIALSAKTVGKAIFVSDAMPAAKCEMSKFELNGQTIFVDNGCCRTADGTLAGSTLTLRDAIVFAVDHLELSLEEALRMASTYPAEAIGRSTEFGHIRAGNHANLVLLDDRINVIETWVEGKRFSATRDDLHSRRY